MAVIQLRSGAYADYDPTKMHSAEMAVILSGDPNTEDGRSLNIGFGSGVTKRVLTDGDAPTELKATNIGSGVVSLSLE